MTINDVIREYLEKNGFDGLYDGYGCFCCNDSIFECDCLQGECQPGYKKPCESEEDGFTIGNYDEKTGI